MNLLSPELTQIAQQLAPYEQSPTFSAVLAETAYQQIVVDGGIVFMHNAEQIKKALLYMMTDGVGIYEVQFWDKTQDQDFYWELYDRCQQLCEQHDLDPVLFYGLKKIVDKPTTVAESLEYFNANELKEILREHGLKVSGNRQELEERVLEHLQFTDLQLMMEQKYHDKMVKYKTKAIRHKYETLRGFLSSRYYFLRDIVRYTQSSQDNVYTYTPYLEFIDADNEYEKTLANFLIPNGFDNVIVHNTVNMMLPLFPNDRSHLRFEMQRQKRSYTPSQTDNIQQNTRLSSATANSATTYTRRKKAKKDEVMIYGYPLKQVLKYAICILLAFVIPFFIF